MLWKIQIYRKKTDKRHNWDAMGMSDKIPSEWVWVNASIDVWDIELLEEYSPTKTLLKTIWMDEPVLIKGDHTSLDAQVNEMRRKLTEGDYDAGEDDFPPPDESEPN